MNVANGIPLALQDMLDDDDAFVSSMRHALPAPPPTTTAPRPHPPARSRVGVAGAGLLASKSSVSIRHTAKTDKGALEIVVFCITPTNTSL